MPSTQHIEISHKTLLSIGAIADQERTAAYVVGGYVRDKLLGKDDADIDILVIGDGIAFARKVASRIGATNVMEYGKFGTAMMMIDGGKVEFVGARKESYLPGSRNPRVDSGTLTDDLLRRDFTVNAIAAGLNEKRCGDIEDPFDGRGDLERRLLRTPLDPVKTFEDDPLRMMRAVRFASQLGFAIDEPAFAAIKTMLERISIVSMERISEEFLKILKSPAPSVGLRLMFESGLLHLVFPEIAQMAGIDQRRDHHHKDVFLHTCTVVDNISKSTDDVWLRFAALVHDIAKPRTKAYKEGAGWTFHGHEELGARMMKSVFRKLKLPQDRLPYVEKLVRLHLRPMALVDDIVTDSAIRRLVFDAGEYIDDLLKLCRADITSKNLGLTAKYLKNYDILVEKIAQVEEKDRLRNWQPPVRGDEIMAVTGLKPGKAVGQLKKAIEEAILDGIIPNEHEAALQYMIGMKDKILSGLTGLAETVKK